LVEGVSMSWGDDVARKKTATAFSGKIMKREEGEGE